jgi:hypothetical protein
MKNEKYLISWTIVHEMTTPSIGGQLSMKRTRPKKYNTREKRSLNPPKNTKIAHGFSTKKYKIYPKF